MYDTALSLTDVDAEVHHAKSHRTESKSFLRAVESGRTCLLATVCETIDQDPSTDSLETKGPIKPSDPDKPEITFKKR